MVRFSVVTGACQGQLDISQAEGICSTGGHKWQRLEGLGCRSGHHVTMSIAVGTDQLAVDIDDGHVDIVSTLDPITPGDLDDQRREGRHRVHGNRITQPEAKRR
jgi:hypothetical protein|tara:strand:+ start:335 stop:646 length:312 start_codon:yes stop_codon:yes gene_type:complete